MVEESFICVLFTLSWAQRRSTAIVMVHISLDSSPRHGDLGQLLHVHLSSIRSVLSNLMQCLLGSSCSAAAVPISLKISFYIIFLLIAAIGSKVTVRSVFFLFIDHGYFLVRLRGIINRHFYPMV